MSLPAIAALTAIWVVCWLFGAQILTDAPIASTSAAGLVVREVRAVRADIEDRAVFAARPRRDPYRHAPGDQLLTGLRGKDVLLVVRRELRPGRRPGHLVLAGGRHRARRGNEAAAGGRAFRARSALPHLADVRRPQLAGALDPAVRALGRQPAALRPARRERPPDAQRRLQAGRLADRRRRAVGRSLPGRRGRRSTTTTRSTTGATSATTARRSRYASMPDQYVYLALQRLELAQDPPPADLRRGRPGVEPHAVDALPHDDRLERRRRRLDLRAHAGAAT